MLTAVLSQATRLSGRLDEALQAIIEATDRADAISEFDRQLFNFDVARWLTAMRGQVLVQLGRFDDARPYLDRMLQTETDSNDITLHLVNVAYVDMAWAMEDRALADFHAERAMAMATESGSPYILVNALACRGVAHLVAGRFARAVESLDKALSVARSRKAGLEPKHGSSPTLPMRIGSTMSWRPERCRRGHRGGGVAGGPRSRMSRPSRAGGRAAAGGPGRARPLGIGARSTPDG